MQLFQNKMQLKCLRFFLITFLAAENLVRNKCFPLVTRLIFRIVTQYCYAVLLHSIVTQYGGALSLWPSSSLRLSEDVKKRSSLPATSGFLASVPQVSFSQASVSEAPVWTFGILFLQRSHFHSVLQVLRESDGFFFFFWRTRMLTFAERIKPNENILKMNL